MKNDSQTQTKSDAKPIVKSRNLQATKRLTLKQLLLSDTARTDFLVPIRVRGKRRKFDGID